ncbi:long-chain-fatty-acid--CoA ligase 6 [Trichonephila clavipes]|nr:long-chain-fatty-acid--CoA ligase 6 [Trichonephila clavipes]
MSNTTKDITNQEIDQESIEIPNSGGARKSKLVSSGNTIEFMFEDTKTLCDVLQRGCRISDNGRSYGWRNSVSDTSYTWINYKQFIKRAENFSSGLLKIRLKQGQSTYVGIYSSSCLEYAITQHGCWCQSMIIIPLYDTLGPAASSFIIKQAEIETVICDTEDKVQRLISKRKEIPTLKHIIMVNDVSKETNQLAKDENIKIHFFKEIEELGEKNPADKLNLLWFINANEQNIKKWASVISLLKKDETDQAIEEPDEIMHINRDSESKYDKSDRLETFELNCNFQMLP